MSLMDLRCQDSICCSKNYIYLYKEKERLLLGKDQYYDYIIYLYFNLPPFSYLKYLKQAKLILFKVPLQQDNLGTNSINQNTLYSVYPLLNFFSIYNYMYNAPSLDCSYLDCSRGVNFVDANNSSYTEIDITSIVKAWKQEDIENKGIILMGKNNNAPLISYASNNFSVVGMQPRIRLIYEENCICPPFVTTACEVHVGN